MNNTVETKKNYRKVFVAIALLSIGLVIAVKLIFFKTPFIYSGTLEATQIDIPARVTSVISKLHIKEGDHVDQGQPLLDLACEDYQLNQEITTRDYNRTERLYRSGSLSQELFDQIRNRKKEADLRMSWCQVRSPLKGVVLNKYHEEGEMVTPGTRLFTLANLSDDIFTYIYVPQGLIAQLKLGQKLQGSLPELKDKFFNGTVTQISNQAEFTPKNVQTQEERTRLVFAIKVFFSNPEETLKPGMTIEIKLPEN
jgi:HlyD family secretion protein